MNNFGTNNHFKLAAAMFKGLFPPLNVHKVVVSLCVRTLVCRQRTADETHRMSACVVAQL
jgi:hypothetical protein